MAHFAGLLAYRESGYVCLISMQIDLNYIIFNGWLCKLFVKYIVLTKKYHDIKNVVITGKT